MPGSYARALWWSLVLVFAGLATLGHSGPLADATWAGPDALFWIVVVGAGLCWIGGVAVVWHGWRSRLAEVTMLGGALTIQSSFGLVHGLTAPGVLYEANHAVSTSILLSVPAALVCAAPLLAPDSAASRTVARSWRAWTTTWVLLATAACAFLLAAPNALPAAQFSSPWTWGPASAALALTALLAWRQLALYEIGGSTACMVVSVALLSLGFSAVTWIGVPEFSVGFWVAHALDILGVLGAGAGAFLGYRTRGSIGDVLRPVTSREPLQALALGMDPLIADFVRDLDAKDRNTREHVVRVSEIAVRTGDRMGLPPRRLRRLGLGALLHDIGKLEIPDAILKKPGRLTDDEMAVMRTHADIGADLVLTRPQLTDVAPVVRAHHERFDGAGYPQGLVGRDIPLEARIVSVCDAYDAMNKTRCYREGLGHEKAVSVLQEHAGSQWDPEAVAALLAVLADNRLASTPVQEALADAWTDTVCADVIPAQPRPTNLESLPANPAPAGD